MWWLEYVDILGRYLINTFLDNRNQKNELYLSKVKVECQNRIGRIDLDQIRTIDKTRILKASDQISAKEIELDKAIINKTFVL